MERTEQEMAGGRREIERWGGWEGWRAAVERESVQVQTVRNGRRTWQVRWTWRGRGTRQARIVRTEQRRAGWPAGQWQEVRGQAQCRRGAVVVSEVWES